MKYLLVLLLAFSATVFSSDNSPVTISDAYIYRPIPGSKISAGYFKVKNKTNSDLVLRATGSDAFERLEMHETIREGASTTMRQIESFALPALKTVEFSEGGNHLMLFTPVKDLDSIQEMKIKFLINKKEFEHKFKILNR